MKYNCKVIQDLLPLYTDGICSDVSAQMVEEHLKECASCEKIAKELQDDSVEKTLGKECDHVVLSHEKKVSKKMVTAGSITAAVLLIPVIVCLICNLAIGHALDWFFIVLTALLVVASVTLVPMLVVEKKAVYTVLAFTGTLVLLLFTCCFYTHGNWFSLRQPRLFSGCRYVLHRLSSMDFCQTADGKENVHGLWLRGTVSGCICF